MAKTPPEILITTPESLYLMLSSNVREILASAEAVIVDEIHAVAQTKRGAHLALTLERLEHLVRANADSGSLRGGPLGRGLPSNSGEARRDPSPEAPSRADSEDRHGPGRACSGSGSPRRSGRWSG